MAVIFPSSGFGDEAGGALDIQLDALVACGLGGLDLRSVDGVNVLDLTDEVLDQVREGCASRGLRVQAIGSPVNKVDLSHQTFGTEVARLRKAIHAAKRTGASRIRLFSPAVPKGQEEAALSEILPILEAMINEAQEAGITLIHENDARYYGAYPEGAKQLFGELGCEHFKAAFDFANTVLIGYRPMDDWFPWLLPHLDTLHIKDALASEGKVVAAGEGDGQLVATISFLIRQGWSGPVTLEPHLQSAGPLGGFSGPELFAYAADRMRAVIEEAGGQMGR
jgi:sugar phosphate isomerase/epimerase